MSDVPLGAFLSGGLDSTIVVGLMSQMMSAPVKTFSIGFEGDAGLRRDRLRAAGGRTIQDRPHRVPRLAVGDRSDRHARLAPRRPVRRLVGGADLSRLEADARAGDGRAHRRRRRRALRRLPALLRRRCSPSAFPVAARPRRATACCRACRRRRTIGTGWPGRSGSAASMGAPLARAADRGGTRCSSTTSRRCSGRISSPGLRRSTSCATSRAERAMMAGRSTLEPGAPRQLHVVPADDLLVKTDRCTMANSLEARSPFLDRELIEYAAGLPDDLKLRGGRTKVILREAFPDLVPAAIDRRGKMGFGVPLDTWFRGELRDHMRDLLLAPDARYRDMLSGAVRRSARRPASGRRASTSASSSGRSCASRSGCGGCRSGRDERGPDLPIRSPRRPFHRRVLDFLKEFMRPSHLACMLALLTPGTVLLFVPSLARWGRRWVAAVVMFYVLLSSPVGRRRAGADADWRISAARVGRGGARRDGGRGARSGQRQPARRRAPAVVGHDGGRVARARGGAALRFAERPARDRFRRGDRARRPAAPESVALQRALIELGVQRRPHPARVRSRRTRATKRSSSSGMLADRGLTEFVLVTSPLHMRRSMLAFEQQGMHPIPSPSPLVPDRSTETNRLLAERLVAPDRRLGAVRMDGARLLLVAGWLIDRSAEGACVTYVNECVPRSLAEQPRLARPARRPCACPRSPRCTAPAASDRSTLRSMRLICVGGTIVRQRNAENRPCRVHQGPAPIDAAGHHFDSNRSPSLRPSVGRRTGISTRVMSAGTNRLAYCAGPTEPRAVLQRLPPVESVNSPAKPAGLMVALAVATALAYHDGRVPPRASAARPAGAAARTRDRSTSRRGSATSSPPAPPPARTESRTDTPPRR